MFIRSERLFLRPGWPEDAAELAQVIASGPVMSNVAALELPGCVDDARELIDGARGRTLPAFFITVPSAGGAKIIGGIGLGHDGPDVELGYWLASEHWGQGYAAEAARAVLSLARALGHGRVIANQFVDDRASLLVLTRAGFRPTGEQRLRRTGDGEAALAAIYVADIDGRCSGGEGPKPSEGSEMRAA